MKKRFDDWKVLDICLAASFFCAGAAVVNLIYTILYFLGII